MEGARETALLHGQALDASAEAEAAALAFGQALRACLGTPLASRLPSAPRADALCIAAVSTRLVGPQWLLGRAAGLRLEAAGADGSADGGGSQTEKPRQAAADDEGRLLSLLLQLCSVELQMCLSPAQTGPRPRPEPQPRPQPQPQSQPRPGLHPCFTLPVASPPPLSPRSQTGACTISPMKL